MFLFSDAKPALTDTTSSTEPASMDVSLETPVTAPANLHVLLIMLRRPSLMLISSLNPVWRFAPLHQREAAMA